MQIVINQERMEQMVTVGELLDMNSGSLPVIVSIMAKFVLGNDGAYLDIKDGLKEIRKLTMAQLKEAAGDFSKKMVETAVPPPSASDSDGPSLQAPQPPQAG